VPSVSERSQLCKACSLVVIDEDRTYYVHALAHTLARA